MQTSSPVARPYKVCWGSAGKNKDRIPFNYNQLKGILATSYQELVQKAILKFPEAGKDFKLVLFEDKTEIGDEEYFQSLRPNTVFLIVPASSPPSAPLDLASNKSEVGELENITSLESYAPGSSTA